MSRNNPIPQALRTEFFAYMAAHDNDDLPDGAWFFALECAAEEYMKRHKLTGRWQCPNSAAHQYVRSLVQEGGAA